jgi:hypothetical protein
MTTKEQHEARSLEEQKSAFKRWMSEPMTRALISQIPACENLELLLQATFEKGFSAGSGATAVSFIEAVLMKGPPKNDDRR